MATRFIQKFDSLADIINNLTAGGIGFVGGQLYINATGAPVPVGGVLTMGAVHIVDPAAAALTNDINETIQDAVDAADSGDVILIAPGSYDEAVTVTTSGLTFLGVGNKGSIGIAPSATNAIAMTVDGTTGTRVSGITLVNVGLEGNGTGGGLYVKGDIRRFRAFNCKIEGGAFAVTLESTAEGDVADTILAGNEFCWTTTAVSIVVSGGGDPVTQTQIYGNMFHNYTTDGIVNSGAHSADLWIENNTFANQEDGTEPTQYLDIAVANTTGLVTNNRFATTILDATKLAIAAGVMWVGNYAQAEGPSTGGGTAGRPD